MLVAKGSHHLLFVRFESRTQLLIPQVVVRSYWLVEIGLAINQKPLTKRDTMNAIVAIRTIRSRSV